MLVAGEGASDRAGAVCAADAAVRGYDVVAIAIDITLNRYLDHDPQGRMYVLEQDLERARAEERQNALARFRDAESAYPSAPAGRRDPAADAQGERR